MEILRKNLSIKLFSLFLAIVLWGTIMNVVRPVTNGYISVPLSIENEQIITSENKVYTISGPNIVRVRFRAYQEQLPLIRQTDFKVYIDFNELIKGPDLPVHCEPLNDSIVGRPFVEPRFVHVNIEDSNIPLDGGVQDEVQDFESIANVSLNVKTVGEVKEGYEIGSIEIAPQAITVSGDRELIENMMAIDVEISVEGADSDITATYNIIDGLPEGVRLVSKDKAAIVFVRIIKQ